MQPTSYPVATVTIKFNAIRRFNERINGGLLPVVPKYKAIEACRELAKSNNAKTIIFDGKIPLFNTLG